VRAERALLVGVILPNSTADPEDPLGELRSLARTAGAEVVDEILARRDRVTPALYVGTGKAQEIADRVVQNDVDVVIFDNDLSPNQIQELEGIVKCKVLDRSELILDIFAAHARTSESLLQVELAQLEYTYPRLAHMWTHLERVAGGATSGAAAVGGIGTRGPGESQIEIDRRLADQRVTRLKREIDEIDRRKTREVLARRDFFTVSLVGYTNAGKSTLMNALTDAGARVEDRLFATVDTLTRRWPLGNGRFALLSDTVGFIRKLPHHLVASFRATLEEAIHADLLLHVVDAANAEAEAHVAAVQGVLDDLGVGDKRALLLLNKSDAVEDASLLTVLKDKHPGALLISARTGAGLEALHAAVDGHMRGEEKRLTLSVPARDGRALHFLERFAEVLDRRYEDGRAIFDVRIAPRTLERLHGMAADIRHAE
jgi:GTP-binding protein HflX